MFTIFDSFLAVQVFTLLSIVLYSIVSNVEYAVDLVFYSVATFTCLLLWNSLFLSLKIRQVRKIKLTDADIRKNKLIMWLSFMTMFAYLILSGFPLLSAFPEEAKLQVSEYPILVRFYRLTGLIPLFVYILTGDDRLKTSLLYYCISMIIFGFLTAFKGYAVLYIIGLVCMYEQNFGVLKKITLAAILLICVFFFIGKAANIEIIDVAGYIINRFSYVQLLGTVELMSIHRDINYLPVISELALLPKKLFTSDSMSLQQILYQSYHSFDPNKLELANFYWAELYYFFGEVGIILFALILILFFLFLRNCKMTPFLLSCAVIMNISVMDGLLNGKLFFRIIDSGLFLVASSIIAIFTVRLISSVSGRG